MMISIRQAIVLLLTMFMFVSSANADIDDKHNIAQFLSFYGNDKLPPPWISPTKIASDESAEARRERIKMIADVITEQAPLSAKEHGWFWSDTDLALATFTKTWYESGRFRLQVHNGKIRGDNGRSVCLGQIMYGSKNLIGTDRDSTRRCVTEVMRHLIKHQKRCLNEATPPSAWAMAKVFAGYGTGHSCSEGAWMPVRDAQGNLQKGNDGRPIKDLWARKRGYTWWMMRKAMMKTN